MVADQGLAPNGALRWVHAAKVVADVPQRKVAHGFEATGLRQASVASGR